MTAPSIQWYPGHIAKAEKQLRESLKRVDVVLEVRDARIPLATHHPEIDHWVSAQAHVLILNRVDMIPVTAREAWQQWFKAQKQPVLFCNAQKGDGLRAIALAAQRAGIALNQRRQQRGMLPRSVRAGVIGFPNVGKSALINRLVGKRVVESARRAGVTRQLRWVRVADDLDLLDSPGVLPAKLNDQQAALKLAFCDDIGEAAYDTQRVAAALVDLLRDLQTQPASGSQPGLLERRYQLDEQPYTGEDYIHVLADQRYQGNSERVAHQILNDFRKGILGAIALEMPPDLELAGVVSFE
jgi:ribosome biogenesis GTPase A